MIITCPGCQKEYTVDDSRAGKRAECKACGWLITVPDGDEPGPAGYVPSIRSQKMNPLVLVAVSGLVMGLVIGSVGGGCIGYRIGLPSDAPTTTGGTSKGSSARGDGTFTRKEFEALVIGKTKNQIIAAVGRPDDTTDQVPRHPRVLALHTEWWYYHKRVINDDTGNPYSIARVYMTYDKAYQVDYP